MKPLKDRLPDPKQVLDMEPQQLGEHVLDILKQHQDKETKRTTIARSLAEHYEEPHRNEVAHAVEEALGWLAAQCLIGASPYDPDLVFITRKGKKYGAEKQEKAEVS